MYSTDPSVTSVTFANCATVPAQILKSAGAGVDGFAVVAVLTFTNLPL